MTKVTVKSTGWIDAPVKIKQGDRVTIRHAANLCGTYVCAQIHIDGVEYSVLVNMVSGHTWGYPQKGDTYTYNDEYHIHFIYSIKITEE